MSANRVLVGRGSEAPVEAAFKTWLVSEGWRLVGAATTWAVVVPTRSLKQALRVHPETRRLLGIRVFEATNADLVVEHTDLG